MPGVGEQMIVLRPLELDQVRFHLDNDFGGMIFIVLADPPVFLFAIDSISWPKFIPQLQPHGEQRDEREEEGASRPSRVELMIPVLRPQGKLDQGLYVWSRQN